MLIAVIFIIPFFKDPHCRGAADTSLYYLLPKEFCIVSVQLLHMALLHFMNMYVLIISMCKFVTLLHKNF